MFWQATKVDTTPHLATKKKKRSFHFWELSMMKKNLLILAVAAAALVSCSSDEVVSQNTTLTGNDIQQKEIAFRPLAQPSTRAAGAAATNAVSGTDFPQNYTMQVAAYNYTDASHKGDYFGTATGVNFVYQYAGGSSAPGTNANYWGGNPAQYWPLSPTTLNFLAVSKVGPAGTDVVTPTFGVGGTSTWAKQVSVALADNKPDATNHNQHDLMYANGQAKVTQSGNVLSFGTNGTVGMTFNHALAWVYFRVKGASAAETTGNYAITINSITLNNAYYAGTFLAKLTTVETSSALSWDSDAANLKWSSPGSQSSNASPHYTYLGESSSKVLTTSFQSVGDGLLVVPTGSMTTPQVSFESFTINYTMSGNTYDYTYTPTDAQKTLLLNKKYVYDITFKLHEIFINPSVQDWTIVNKEILPSTTLAELKTQINSGKDCSGYIGYYVDASGNVLETDVSAIGVIAGFTNSSTDADDAYPGSRIYVIAKSDGIGADKSWASSGTTYATSGTTGVTYGSRTGYSQTSGLYTLSNTDFPAAKYAWEYQGKNGAAVITGSSGWFLPSEIQMVDFAQKFSKLSNVLSLSTYYWTSNQADATTSRYVYIRPDGLYGNSNANKTSTRKACPCFVY